MAITALGTEFNVKAYPEEDIITTSLIEGKVRVDCNDTISYVLTPGYQVVYNKCTADCQVLTANMKDVTAWQRGEIVFNKATIAEIIQTLERHLELCFMFLRRNVIRIATTLCLKKMQGWKKFWK